MYKKTLIVACCLITGSCLAMGSTPPVSAEPEAQPTGSSGPLEVFDAENYGGGKAVLAPHTIYSGDEIPNSLGEKISSLILKKGYQVCIATTEDGTGPAKVLIAAKRDIRIPLLSEEFNNSIKFIRVLPWRNTVKKGHCGKHFKGLNQGWFYVWGPIMQSTEEIQWTPMSFGRWHAGQKRIDLLIEQEGIQDLLCFNEIDHDGHQGAVDGYLFVHENAVAAMGDLAKTGLRLGGPSLRENGPKDWLPEFCEMALEQDVRIDFLGVHWYDWGGKWMQGQAEKMGKTEDEIAEIADPEAIFKRFKSYLSNVYKDYQLPMWITEFNCNPKRDMATQIAFLELALPYLDSLPYVERYSYFQPFGGNGNFREERKDTDTPLTEIGEFWRDYVSVPAMDKEVYLGENNLFYDEIEEEQ